MTVSEQCTILVVDDEQTNIEVLASIFEGEHEVLFAKDGAKALEIAKTALPDIILLDVLMPGMDGYEVCRLLKSQVATAEIPVIFITALGSPEAEQRGFEVGGADYIHYNRQDPSDFELLGLGLAQLSLFAAKTTFFRADNSIWACNMAGDHLEMACGADLPC